MLNFSDYITVTDAVIQQDLPKPVYLYLTKDEGGIVLWEHKPTYNATKRLYENEDSEFEVFPDDTTEFNIYLNNIKTLESVAITSKLPGITIDFSKPELILYSVKGYPILPREFQAPKGSFGSFLDKKKLIYKFEYKF